MSRRDYIGSSDIAAVMGLSRWSSPFKLWAIKTGKLEEDDLSDKEYIEWGNRLEEVVAKKFSEKNNVKLMAYKKRFKHEKYPYMTCELDRVVVGTDEIVECKTANAWKYKEWAEEDDIPQEYVLQVIFAMGIAKRKVSHIAVLVGGNRYFERKVLFDKDLFEKMVASAKHFVEYYMAKDIPPVAMEGDSETLLKLHPQETEDIIVSKDGDEDELVGDLQFVKAQIANFVTQKEALEAKIKQKIGESVGLDTLSFKVFWKAQGSSRVDSKLLKADGIYDKYVVKGSTRVLRVTRKKEGKK